MGVEGLNSNLNLNAGAPPRVQPRLGEWGPLRVPATRAKKRMRWWVSLAFVGAIAGLVLYGWWVNTMLNGG